MHVHANYSQQLASVGAGQLTANEIAARRSVEVRKKLSLAAGALNHAGDEITGVNARVEERQQNPQSQQPDEGEFGQLFSAHA